MLGFHLQAALQRVAKMLVALCPRRNGMLPFQDLEPGCLVTATFRSELVVGPCQMNEPNSIDDFRGVWVDQQAADPSIVNGLSHLKQHYCDTHRLQMYPLFGRMSA